MPIRSFSHLIPQTSGSPAKAGRSGAVADLTRGDGATFVDTTITAFGFPPDVRPNHASENISGD